mmetsp:Transcript_23457/g.21333  ORF Transcript_23457/g.21333 Transcript_23457/m.21333 type:complete len:283 (+) Transcript_23457:50-898(+)
MSNDNYRNYDNSKKQEIVENHYKLMRINQTVEFVNRMRDKYSFNNNKYRLKMSIRDAFKELEGYVDSSDPDTDLPNLIHMLQTAEGIRKDGHPDWMQLVGLLHDMGKIMYLWGISNDGQEGTATGQQWALGGDTWVVGCEIPNTVVFPQFNELNKDSNNIKYTSKYGIYDPHCGLDNLLLAYGHDEYMYHMLVANKTTIPKEGLAMIRYHSFYPWHSGKSYSHLTNEEDDYLLEWILKFNKYDLYTKNDNNIDDINMDKLWPYYHSLIIKYFPNSNVDELVW